MNILEKLSIESDGKSVPKSGKVTIGYIKRKLGSEFEQEMDMESDDETSELIFPTSFHILMHPDDYENRKVFFERWGPIILSRIYAVIRKKKCRMELKHKLFKSFGKKYPKVKYMPTDARWCIQFTPVDVGGNLRKGDLDFILSYTIPFKIEYAQNTPRIVQDPNCTMMTRDPKTKELREQPVEGIRTLGEGVRIYPFDKSLQDAQEDINELFSNSKKELATLQWNNLEWPMYDTYIEISGMEETRKGSNIIKINSDRVKRTHVAIQYKDNGFQLAAWGKTMINERDVELSTDPAHIKWEKLMSKSTIVLNDAVVVRFKANLAL